MGNGSSTFTGPNTGVTTDSNGSKIIDTADLNGDGYVDWIDATNTSATAPYWMVSLGNGTTAFNAAVQWKSVTRKIRVYKPSTSTVGAAATITAPDVSQDLVDVTGDGLPDLLYTEYNSSLAKYEFKMLKNNGSGFNGTPVLWTYPAGYTPPSAFRTFGNSITTGTIKYMYTSGLSDLIDLTGDGCPDFIRIESGNWQLYRNLACDQTPTMGFAAPVAMNWRGVTPPTALSYAKQQVRTTGSLLKGTLRYVIDGPSKTQRSLLDLNGDGITDVYTGFVYFGTGEGFIQESADSTFRGDLSTILGAIDVDKPIGYANSYGLHVSVADVNADGKLDVIKSNADILYYDCLTRNNGSCTAQTTWVNEWSVYLNTGSGFLTTAKLWWAARFVPSTLSVESTETTSTDPGTEAAGTYYPFGFIQGTNPPFTAEHNKYQFGRLGNFDGEGAVDFLRANGTSWTVYRGSPGRPDLLVKANTGLGGNTTLAYADTIGKRDGGNLHFPRATLQSQVTKDGLDTVGAGVQTTYTTTYSYSGSYYDRAGREFNGFGKVAVIRSDNTGSPTSRTETQFAVGNPSRILIVPLGPDPGGAQCTETWSDSVALAGMPIGIRRGPHSAGTDADFLSESWSPWETSAGAMAGVLAPELRKTRVIDRDSAGVARKLRVTKRVYGSFGNVTSSTNLGDTQANAGCGSLNEAFASDEVTTSLSYAANTTKWNFAPQSVRQCADQGCLTVLRDTRLFYDSLAEGSIDKGDLTSREVWSQFGGEMGSWVTDSAVFDAYGNVTRQTDPDGAIFDFVFADGAGGGSHAYLRSSSAVVAKGKTQPVTFTASTSWDEKFGVALSTTAPNGRRISQSTDGLGRVLQVKSTPPESATGTEIVLADLSYFLGGATGSNTTNYVRRLSYFAATGSIESRTYLDGLGRPVQSKSQAEGAQWITSAARATYFGSLDVSTLPYFTTVPEFSAITFSETNPATSINQADFDWAGRVATQKLVVPGGVTHFVTSASYSLWDQRVTDPKGISILYQRDAYGRIAVIKENLDAAVTRYAFDRVGALTSVTDAANNVINMRYDTRGLRRELEDADLSNCGGPQNCARKFFFDNSGRLTRQIDAKAQEKVFSLDELGRPYLQQYVCGTNCNEVDVTVIYDGTVNALGLATRVERGATNVLAPTYDNWQRATNVSQTIADSTFTASMTFDWHGRVQNLTYPTGEIASYFYNARGAANRLTFAGADIVSSASYDALGRATELAWGNGLFTRTTFKASQLLSTIRVENAGATHLAFDYRDHDLNGNPTRVYEDVGFPGQGAWNREYQYDWANRLTIGKHWVGATLEKDWEWRYDDVGNMTYCTARIGRALRSTAPTPTGPARALTP